MEGEITVKRILVMILSVMLFASVLSAQNALDAVRIVQDEMGFGTRALAMGGAYVALADDYTGIYWNPAGLAWMKRSQFWGEVSHLSFNNAATFAGQLTDDSQNYTRLRSLGLAFPLPTRRGSFVVALGYNRVRDFDRNLLFAGINRRSNGLSFTVDDVEYAFDRDLFQREEVSDEGGLNQWAVGAGIAASPNVTVGATLIVWDGNDDYELSFFQEDRNHVYEGRIPLGGGEFTDFHSYERNRTLNTDYSGVGLKLGALFRVTPGMRLGAAVGIPTTFTVEETFAENDLLIFDDGFEDAFEFPSGRFKYKVRTPFHFDGGLALRNRYVTFAAGLRYRDWSQTRFKVDDRLIDDPDFQALLEENRILRQDFRATVDYHLGGEVYLQGLKARLRGGYAVFPTPLENASDDLDKKFISLGISFVVDRYVTLDITYLRGTWKQTSEDEFTPGGTLEEITAHKFLAGLSYRF